MQMVIRGHSLSYLTSDFPHWNSELVSSDIQWF